MRRKRGGKDKSRSAGGPEAGPDTGGNWRLAPAKSFPKFGVRLRRLQSSRSPAMSPTARFTGALLGTALLATFLGVLIRDGGWQDGLRQRRQNTEATAGPGMARPCLATLPGRDGDSAGEAHGPASATTSGMAATEGRSGDQLPLPATRHSPTRILGAEDGAAGDDGGGEGGKPATTSPMFPPPFHSRPGAPAVVYVDFVGPEDYDLFRYAAHLPATGYVFDLDGDNRTFSELEYHAMWQVWSQLALDYAASETDVTTDPLARADTVTYAVVTSLPDSSDEATSGKAVVRLFGPQFSETSGETRIIYYWQATPSTQLYASTP